MVSDLIEKELKAGTVPARHAIRLCRHHQLDDGNSERTNWSGWNAVQRNRQIVGAASTYHRLPSPG